MKYYIQLLKHETPSILAHITKIYNYKDFIKCGLNKIQKEYNLQPSSAEKEIDHYVVKLDSIPNTWISRSGVGITYKNCKTVGHIHYGIFTESSLLRIFVQVQPWENRYHVDNKFFVYPDTSLDVYQFSFNFPPILTHINELTNRAYIADDFLKFLKYRDRLHITKKAYNTTRIALPDMQKTIADYVVYYKTTNIGVLQAAETYLDHRIEVSPLSITKLYQTDKKQALSRITDYVQYVLGPNFPSVISEFPLFPEDILIKLLINIAFLIEKYAPPLSIKKILYNLNVRMLPELMQSITSHEVPVDPQLRNIVVAGFVKTIYEHPKKCRHLWVTIQQPHTTLQISDLKILLKDSILGLYKFPCKQIYKRNTPTYTATI